MKNKVKLVTFPEKTAKEIVDECNNSIPGGKLLWKYAWARDQDFYSQEKCRPRTIKVPTEILHAGKSWNECKELIGEENMFNFAEILYMLSISESFRKLLTYSSDKETWWTWTSSRASGGNLAFAGDFNAGGVNSFRWKPWSSNSDMGVCLSRSE